MKKLLFGLACLMAFNQQSSDVFAGALRQGEFSVIPYGGIAPSTFVKRKKSAYIVNGAYFNHKAPNFSKLFEFPFSFGGSIGYNLTNQFEVFVDVSYTIADRGKKVVAHSISPNNLSSLKYIAGTFGALGTYLGGRYYYDCGGTWYPFVGGKVGVVARKEVKNRVVLNPKTDGIALGTAAFFASGAAFSGGAELGLDAELAEYVDFILRAEVVGSGRLKATKKNLPFFNRVGGMFTFPVSLGIRFRMY